MVNGHVGQESESIYHSTFGDKRSPKGVQQGGPGIENTDVQIRGGTFVCRRECIKVSTFSFGIWSFISCSIATYLLCRWVYSFLSTMLYLCLYETSKDTCLSLLLFLNIWLKSDGSLVMKYKLEKLNVLVANVMISAKRLFCKCVKCFY